VSLSHDVIRSKVVDEVRNSLRDVINELKQSQSGFARHKLEELMKVVDDPSFHGIVSYYELPVEGGRIDIDVFNKIIFEVKVSEREFREAEDTVKNRYVPSHKSASYAIITNYSRWRFYKVVENNVVFDVECDVNNARVKLKEIFSSILREKWGLHPEPELVLAIFKDVIDTYGNSLLKVLNNSIETRSVKPLYTAFKAMMLTIYNELTEDDIKKLYVTHTLLQMITASALADALNLSHDNPRDKCRGLNLPVEVVLPYLTWWYVSYNDMSEEDRKTVDEVVNKISIKTSLINWRGRVVEDVFRELYEYFIDPETRRKIGEYYTPLWLVELIISKIKSMGVSFKDNIILDPFCGSGTFLVMSFSEKIAEGEDPNNAFLEVIGFDLNPLAVTIARAELILAYLRSISDISHMRNIQPPLIFHADSIEPFLTLVGFTLSESSSGSLQFNELNTVRRVFDKFLRKNGVKQVGRDTFKDLQSLEKRFMFMLRDASTCVGDGSKSDEVVGECVKNAVKNWIKPDFFSDAFIKEFTKFLAKDVLEEFSDAVSTLLKSYGNGVWATPFTSLLALAVVTNVGCDIVVTNPPWLQITKHKATYAGGLRNKAKALIGKVCAGGSENIVKGSDLASMALYYGIKTARKAVGYVMPRESTFYHKTSQRAGQILTYAVLKNFEGSIDKAVIIDMNYDVFQHGNLPSLVIVRKVM